MNDQPNEPETTRPADPPPPATPEAPTLPPSDASGVATTPGAGPAAPASDIASQLHNHPRYRVLRLLGQGGMGAVYLAEHLFMSRQVALKVVSTALMQNDAALERFRQEVKAAAQLSHHNIVTAYDADHVGGLHFLVMEYIEGVTLADHLARTGPLPVNEACGVIEQAAHGLQHAHEKGMIHRDIKPQNLMLTRSGVVKILDFGLARFAREQSQPQQASLTGTGVVMGTADYIAPEQTRSSRGIDIRADIYGLGCTLYHLLAGRVPFPDGTVVDKMIRHSMDEPDPLRSLRPDVPRELVLVVDKMMAKEPVQRFQVPAEVAAALHSFLGSRLLPIVPVLDVVVATEDMDEGTAPYVLPTVLYPREKIDDLNEVASTTRRARPVGSPTAPLSTVSRARDTGIENRRARPVDPPAAPGKERSALAVVLGGFSLVIGVVAIFMALGLSLCCFALGWLTVPFSGVGLTLGTIGVVVPLVTKRSGVILPACGVAANAVALLVVIGSHLLGMSAYFGSPSSGPGNSPPTEKAVQKWDSPRVVAEKKASLSTEPPPGTIETVKSGDVVVHLVSAVQDKAGSRGLTLRFKVVNNSAQGQFSLNSVEKGIPLSLTTGMANDQPIVVTSSSTLPVNPGQQGELVLGFGAPPAGTEPLRLQIPASQFKSNALVFTIPRNKITK
jgi:serine/threonine protein kinase